jgi:hypothetical protein
MFRLSSLTGQQVTPGWLLLFRACFLGRRLSFKEFEEIRDYIVQEIRRFRE